MKPTNLTEQNKKNIENYNKRLSDMKLAQKLNQEQKQRNNNVKKLFTNTFGKLNSQKSRDRFKKFKSNIESLNKK